MVDGTLILVAVVVVALLGAFGLCWFVFKTGGQQVREFGQVLSESHRQSSACLLASTKTLDAVLEASDKRIAASDSHTKELAVMLAAAHKQSLEQSQKVLDTISERFVLLADQNLDIVEAHLQAKRDEWDGKNGAPRAARPASGETPAPEHEEANPLDWSGVSVTNNGRA